MRRAAGLNTLRTLVSTGPQKLAFIMYSKTTFHSAAILMEYEIVTCFVWEHVLTGSAMMGSCAVGIYKQYFGMEFGMRSCRKSLTTIESTGNSEEVRTWALQIGDMQSSGFRT